MSSHRPFALGHGAVNAVPYIALWSSEEREPGPVVYRNGGIAYPDETPVDRDADGVLWSRVGSSPGKGRPDFGAVHFLRQRRAMRRGLCQVCGGRPERPEEMVWLLDRDEYEENPWPAPIVTSHPPVCPPCARRAVRGARTCGAAMSRCGPSGGGSPGCAAFSTSRGRAAR